MLKYYNLWIIGTVLLYYFGPVDWEGRSAPTVALVVAPCLLALNIGALIGAGVAPPLGPAATRPPRSLWPSYLAILAYAVLMDVQLRYATGLTIFSLSSYSLDFEAVYSNFVEQGLYGDGKDLTGQVMNVVKGLFFIPLLLILSRDFLERWTTVILIFALLCASSLLRGTDKELFDLFFISLILYYHKRKNKINLILPGLVLALLLFLFLERRISRLGGDLPDCILGGEICLTYDTFFATQISPGFELLAVFITNYITQGYEGLSIAYPLSADFNFGVGHLPLLKRALCTATGLLCETRDFQSQLTEIGWDTNHRWTSVYPILANDLGWFGAPLYFVAIGVLYGASARWWREKRDRISLATIILITFFIVFSSANMQLSINFDWLMAAMFFFTLQFGRILGRLLSPAQAGRPAESTRR